MSREALQSSGTGLATRDDGDVVGRDSAAPGQVDGLTDDDGSRGRDGDLCEGSGEKSEESDGECSDHIDDE